ncbi:hypothetical protein RclHR1_01330031 [Rhizophagus clarus]|uniref:Uncharacterized protein n=1 Tax=Rhizophagus clarus TaxID=94130 RepID=A0A2Z6Q9N9_9GLOM|nr:hypothetical protein RclHR1_01330031 [Rhizophagus clarus]GES79866.1 hypothetical protein GLOIN_2v1733058 [Rhizophagus clarus]
MKLLLILVHIIVYCFNECTAGLTTTTVLESTVGFGLIETGPSPFTDNTILLRAVRLDYTNGVCNEPTISFRAVRPGQDATVYSLDLADDGNARIPPDNFCPEVPISSKKKRGYIFYENHIKDRSFYKRSPTTAHSLGPSSHPSPSHPASPSDSGVPTPEPSATQDSSSPSSSPSSGSGDSGDSVGSSGSGDSGDGDEQPGPHPAKDKIKVLTFYNEFVLIYYPCSGKVCGDIYSLKNIKNLVTSIDFAGNCDETSAVQGPNGFLYLCYHDVDSSVEWENWITDGTNFNKTYFGTITNVTIPNKVESESFDGALFKVFSIGPSQYSIIMGSIAGKPNLETNIYNPPINLYAYFLTNTTIISGPYPIYQDNQFNGYSAVEFQIQTCKPIEGGNGGYKCLLSIKANELDSYTKFVEVTFSSTGEQLSTTPFEFDIQHAPGATTPASLNLNAGGFCIAIYTESKGLDWNVYNEDGIQRGTWGIPTGEYGALGSTPNNYMWAVKSFTDTSSWSLYFTDILVGFNGYI